MTRLPHDGGDSGNWGKILNDFLEVEHNPDGTLKKAGDIAAAKAKANSSVQSVNTKTPDANGAVSLVKGDVGLSNVDNTSDADKPVSTAAQTVLDAKAPIDSPNFTGVPKIYGTAIATQQQLGSQQPMMKVSDLTYPLVIAHRGGASLWPENTLEAYKGAAGLGLLAIEAGDVQALRDGTLVCMHDGTVDRTTAGTGPVNAFTSMGWRQLAVDPAGWLGGNWPNTTPPVWTDVLADLGGRVVLVPECKDGLDSTASAMCDLLTQRGLQESAIIQSFVYSNTKLVAGRGFATMVLGGAVAQFPSIATMHADGIWSVCVDHNAADLTSAWVSQAHAAGIKVFTYTVDHQNDWDQTVALGCDGAFSNDPLYAARNYAAYRGTTTSWNTTGTWANGCIRQGDGPFNIANRGNIVGGQGVARWRLANVTQLLPGEVTPVADPGGSYTVTVTYASDTIDSDTAQGLAIYVAAPNDSLVVSSGDIPKSYLIKLRANGALASWRIDNGASVSNAAQTTTALQVITLSSALASGVAVTSLPVTAISQAVKSGHQFYLPTGQVVTVSAAAGAGSTSISVTSVTPTAAVVNGALLPQRATVAVTVTPTSVKFSRVDEPASVTVSDTTYRGGYIVLRNTAANGVVSVEKVTIS